MVEKLLNDNHIPFNCERLNVFIDNQNVSHSAKDSLNDYLISYFNENNYSCMGEKPSTPYCTKNISVSYRDSKHDYLIQLADLIANTCLNNVKYPELNISRLLHEHRSEQYFP